MSRLIGGILLVSGTTIGAGMLALPVITSFSGFLPSFLALFLCWVFFYTTAQFFLDVTLAFPGNVNLVTMAGQSLGVLGKAVCWLVYLFLLYSLTAAYIAGSAPLFEQGFSWIGVVLPGWARPLPLLVLFGFFVYFGTKTVDLVNRILMICLALAYAGLISALPPYVQMQFLAHSDYSAVGFAVPVLFTSFGYHIIIPTLTTYLSHDKKKLKQAILIGSLIPLAVYGVWEYLVLGVVPLEGKISLMSAWQMGQPATTPLAEILQIERIQYLSGFFAFFAIVTSFLGVSISLSDFLGDGLKMHRFTWGREAACLLTFIPPLIFVAAYERAFLIALKYSGIFVAMLLGILPALMAWKLPGYQSPPKRALLTAVIFISTAVIAKNLIP